jgi:adenylate kinase
MKIVFLGSPSVGKGTVADYLKEKYNFEKISTGDLLRENISKNTPLGIQANSYITSGNLVPDSLVIKIVKEAIKGLNDFILDGFPRTIKQAEALTTVTQIDKVVNFTAKKETIIDRISGRRICPTCKTIYHIRNIPPKIAGFCDKDNSKLIQRDDDKKETINKRLEDYKKQAKPLKDFYKKQGLLVEVDTDKPLEQIFSDTEKVLGLN